MNGRGTGTAAITFLNALFTGTGAAAGIALEAEATARVERSASGSFECPDPTSDTPLVRATVSAALAAWGSGGPYSVEIRVDSRIPVARGLKSSSGVGVAVARAVAAAVAHPVSPTEAACLVAEVGQQVGVSATGAFDDCLAAAEPGVHVTENARRQRLRTDQLDPSWTVVVAVPDAPHRPSPEYLSAFRRAATDAASAQAAAEQGDYARAMRQNTRLVERAMGYPYAPARERLERLGAIACGVSGMGPAFAAVVPEAMEVEARGLLQEISPTTHSAAFTRASLPARSSERA